MVRCVNLDNKAYLLSGGSDSGMIVWDIATGNRVSTAKSHSRAVLDLAVDPESEIRPQVFSASSEPNLRVFELSPSPFSVSEVQEPILEHETSVNKLYFDADGDLWTASSDKTAKRLVRANNWKPDTELVHPDFVRDVVVHEQGGWVVTACRDEEVRVWDRAVCHCSEDLSAWALTLGTVRRPLSYLLRPFRRSHSSFGYRVDIG